MDEKVTRQGTRKDTQNNDLLDEYSSDSEICVPNLNPEIVKKFEEIVGDSICGDADGSPMVATVSPQLLSYHLRDADGSSMVTTASPLLLNDYLRDADGSPMEATASPLLLNNHLPDAEGSHMEATASPQLLNDHLRDADGSPMVTTASPQLLNDHLPDGSTGKFIIPYFDKHDVEHLKWGTNLPHWHQDDKYVFITFRLADSLPQAKLKEYTDEKELWIKRHPKPWSDDEEYEYQEKFASTIDKWLDLNYGECLLKDPINRKIVEDALLFFDGERYNLKAFVVMPNHVHLLMQLKQGFNIESIMRSLKSFTAKGINKAMNRTGRLWQSEYFDRIIRSEEHYKHVLKYIVANDRNLAKVKDDCIPFCVDIQ